MQKAAGLPAVAMVAASLLLAQSRPAAQERGAFSGGADLVVLGGRVWTGDPAISVAQAVAVKDGRIVAVGSDQEVRRWMRPWTRVVEARGNSVVPGFIDSHVHFSNGGFEISGVQLRDAATPEEFARRIGAHARKLPKGEWILGGTWDHELWGGTPLPSREMIDAVTPENPVFVSRYDGHMALANSVALKRAGVTRDTETPAGGAIVKDANGEPTGLLKDAAMELVFRVVPDPTEEQLTRAIQAALAEARRFGVTSIHDISSAPDFRIYQKLAARGELTARIYALMPIRDWESLARTGIRPGFGSEWVRNGALKAFADGSLGSTTALFYEPFNDEPDTSGLASAILEDGSLRKWAFGADKAGLQLCIHAIGDKANRMILDVFAEAVRENGGDAGSRRFRIEHAQHIRPGDFAKFAELGVIASMQPYHAIDDGRWAEKRIGPERCKTTYAFRTFLDHKVKLAFGSDWTVAPLDPIQGVYAAVTRRTLDGKNPNGWYPEQKITLAEALEAYTMGSAYAEFAEHEKGSLSVGKLADIVVLDADLFATAPEKLNEVKVRFTIAGGRVVYELPEKK